MRLRDPDAGLRASATVWGAALGAAFSVVGVLLGRLLGLQGLAVVTFAIVVAIVVGVTVRRMAMAIAEGAGASFLAFLQPSGRSSPYEPEYSMAQSLAARDDVAGAMAWYDAQMASQPADDLVRLQAADLHARAGDARRAEALYADARRLTTDRGRELYATQRLIDLRLGPLDEPERALPELRRLSERFPGTPEAKGAREALARLKLARRDGS